MRVLVNALAAGPGGGGTYAQEQLAALGTLPDIELTVLATEATAERLREGCPAAVRIVEKPARSLPLRLCYEQFVLPLMACAYDVVYLTGNFAMFGSPRPQVVTFQNPAHFGRRQRAYWRTRYSARARLRLELERLAALASVRRAEAAIAISRSLRAAMEEDVGEQAHVHLLLSAPPSMPEPKPGAAPPETPSPPYVLAVANDYPHKDWDGLVSAFRLHADLPQLVIVGAWRHEGRLRELFAGDGGNATRRVTFLGEVADRRQVAALYRNASCYVAHSFLEAFPLTPSEALAHGLPVVASDIPPHREVCGDDALFYPLSDPGALAEAVRRAIGGRGQPLQALPRRGSRTWLDNARELADILRGVVSRTS